MRILLWHVHGSWTTSFVQGSHEYLVPVTSERGPDGLGRADTWTWPPNVTEVPLEELDAHAFDVVLLQRQRDIELTEQLLSRKVGQDVPGVYLEHNTPGGAASTTRHPLADQEAVPVVHVTHFNALMWDMGAAPTQVIEHGVVDPGYRYRGQLPRAAVVVNDPMRRGRAVGTDLIFDVADHMQIDVFGMNVSKLRKACLAAGHVVRTFDGWSQQAMHEALPDRRVYLHTARWTSLGLSLLEAMHLGLPVVAIATTEVPRALPAAAGVASCDLTEIREALHGFEVDPEAATAAGLAAREFAMKRYGLDRFLTEWDQLLDSLVAGVRLTR